MALNIAKNLQLPREAVTSVIVVYGARGMGKTNGATVIAEELHHNGLRFSVIDPMGVWFGLQYGRTKQLPGLEVLILGGIHGDIPIEPTAGTIVADLVADETISVVIDISRTSAGKAWSKGQKIRFVTDYMLRLYERQVERRIPIMQIIDEAARYAPQSFISGDKDTAHCLGAIQMVAEEGRNLGIGLTLITQRSARLNKDIAELADMLMAFRIVGPNSVDAIMDWFGSHVPKDRHKQLVEELRSLPIGTALIVSPGWIEIEASANIRMRETFDSSATPKIGQSIQAPGKAKKPDLEKYRALMAETIEKAESSDPKHLKKEINRLESELEKERNKKPTPGPAPDPIEIPVIDIGSLEAIEKKSDDLWNGITRFFQMEGPEYFTALSKLIQDVKSKQPDDRSRILPSSIPDPPFARGLKDGSIETNIPAKIERKLPIKDFGELSPLHRSMLNGIALLNQLGNTNPSIMQVGAVIGKSHKSGRIRGAFNYTHDAGYTIMDGTNIRLTEAGRNEAMIPDIRSHSDIHDLWLNRLKGNELDFLNVLIDQFPNQVGFYDLGQAIGKDIRSGRVKGALNALRDKGLARIDEANHQAVASDLLFPKGLK